MKLSIKNIVCLLLVMLIGISSAKAEKEMKIEGIFQGVNLYIMNPFATTGVGFCITKITVNGKAALDDTNRSSIELNLSLYQLKKGEQITVIIQHKDGCTPKVLNVDALKPKSTFTLVSTKFDKTTNTFSLPKNLASSICFCVRPQSQDITGISTNPLRQLFLVIILKLLNLLINIVYKSVWCLDAHHTKALKEFRV
ncbi:MAG: hypothetical protein II165_01845 [Bacteroidales bacterium]|nr:hypothetical protein [Bacteroidales bacterium]